MDDPNAYGLEKHLNNMQCMYQYRCLIYALKMISLPSLYVILFYVWCNVFFFTLFSIGLPERVCDNKIILSKGGYDTWGTG